MRTLKAQKAWHDQNVRVRTLNKGDMLLVLLPMSFISALTAQWLQLGKVNYSIDMHDQKKRKRVFHINMLQEFLSNRSVLCTSYSNEDLNVDEDDEILVWNVGSRTVRGD